MGFTEEELAVLGAFCEEANELLEEIEPVFVELEGSPQNIKLVNHIFRAFHTIKGNSAYFGLTRIKEFAHGVEDMLHEVRQGDLVVTPALVDTLLAAADHLGKMILHVQDLDQVPAEGDKQIVEALYSTAGSVGESGFDAFTGLFGEILEKVTELIELNEYPELADNLSRATRMIVNSKEGSEDSETATESEGGDEVSASSDAPPCAKEENEGVEAKSASVKKRTMRVDEAKVDQFMGDVGEVLNLVEIFTALQRNVEAGEDLVNCAKEMKLANRAFQEVADKMQADVLEIRQVPIRGVMTKLHRIIRDTGRELDKQVEVETIGEELLIDKSYVETLEGPLVHMVRNAIDHGVETPEERAKSGKSAEGQIRIEYRINKDSYEVIISDDGRGMNPGVLKAKGVERGVITATEADVMSDEEVFQLIFAPGFSTASTITDVSGRGVGMDVVMSEISKVGGDVKIESCYGAGSTFTLELPRALTLVVVSGLLVLVGGSAFIIPMEALRETIDIDPAEITKLPGGDEVINVRDRTMPFIRLAQRLAMGAPDGHTQGVVVCHRNKEATVEISQALGLQKVVVKRMEDSLMTSPSVRGGAVLGDGAVGLVLDVSSFL